MFNLIRNFVTEAKPKPLLKRVLSVRKVARVNSGGKIRTTSALVVLGDRNGHAGYGMGRADDLAGAVQKATEIAKKNMKYYFRLDNRTIHSDVEFKYHASVLKLKSARPGFGVIANNNVHEVMRCVGISDLYCKVGGLLILGIQYEFTKVYGSTNPMNVVKATFAALDAQKMPNDIAKLRGMKVSDVRSVYYGLPYSEKENLWD